MKKSESRLLGQVVAAGIPRELAMRAIPWHRVHADPKLGLNDISLDIARNLASVGDLASLIPGLPIDPTDILSLIKFLVSLIPGAEPAPRPMTIPPTVNKLVWCQKKMIGKIAAGENARIEASENGMPFNPFDTDGTVELTDENGKSLGTITGNGSVTVCGPAEIWAHLSGGTKDDKDEDECKIKVEVSKFVPPAK